MMCHLFINKKCCDIRGVKHFGMFCYKKDTTLQGDNYGCELSSSK